MLEVKNLRAGYGSAEILTNLNLTARPGELVGLLGPNGCGKTTLLRTVSGNLRPKSGEIRWNGVDLCSLSPKELAREIAYLPQETAAADGLSALDLIELGLMPARGIFFRLSAQEERKIAALAGEYGIAGMLDRELSALSGGERRLVSLLRAEVQDTPVLLLDEPSGALDFNHMGALYDRMKMLCRDRGKLILAVLHDPAAALAVCDRILLMRDGGILREIDPGCGVRELEEGLRLLYPGIRVFEQDGQRFCGRRSSSICEVEILCFRLPTMRVLPPWRMLTRCRRKKAQSSSAGCSGCGCRTKR